MMKLALRAILQLSIALKLGLISPWVELYLIIWIILIPLLILMVPLYYTNGKRMGKLLEEGVLNYELIYLPY
jgi:hypothetical protein